jgi:hypothetical protein
MARLTTIPVNQRSKQLAYYHRVVKPARPPNPKYNKGQLRADLSQATPFQKYLAVRLYNKKNEAKRRGVAFELDVEWALQQHPICAVTGEQLTFGPEPSALKANIDQIIPGGGYTKTNTRIVAAWFNEAKKAYSDVQIQRLICSAADHIKSLESDRDQG